MSFKLHFFPPPHKTFFFLKQFCQKKKSKALLLSKLVGNKKVWGNFRFNFAMMWSFERCAARMLLFMARLLGCPLLYFAGFILPHFLYHSDITYSLLHFFLVYFAFSLSLSSYFYSFPLVILFLFFLSFLVFSFFLSHSLSLPSFLAFSFFLSLFLFLSFFRSLFLSLSLFLRPRQILANLAPRPLKIWIFRARGSPPPEYGQSG